jgi:hypothetical protein
LPANYLLLLDDLEQEYAGAREYGFVASNTRQRELRRRIESKSEDGKAEGENWALFPTGDISLVPFSSNASRDTCQSLSTNPAAWVGGIQLTSLEVLQGRAAPGDSVTIHLCYATKAQFDTGGSWVGLEVRFLGPRKPIPGVFMPLSKLYRKLLQEKSLRSSSSFGLTLIPGEGYPREAGSWGEERRIGIPPGLESGRYEVSAKLVRQTWRPVHKVGDYLEDQSGQTGRPLDQLVIKGE